jgi:hypothetical protein
MKKAALAAAILIAVTALTAACSPKPGPRLREIERFSEMSDEEIDKAKSDCYLIATTDYNCADLIPARHGMSTQEWKELNTQTKICRQNQALSYNQCLRGKGVRYSEFE